MSVYNAINLAGLPLPNVLEPIDFELEVTRIRAEISAKFADDHPIQAALSLESEPINKIIEVLAYRYVLKIAEINRKARSLMLAFATGSDLDHIFLSRLCGGEGRRVAHYRRSSVSKPPMWR